MSKNSAVELRIVEHLCADFKGVWIPKEIWLDETLTALQKVLLMEIDILDSGSGCHASNEYLAAFCGYDSSQSLANAMSELRKRGWIITKGGAGKARTLSVNWSRIRPTEVVDLTLEVEQEKVDKGKETWLTEYMQIWESAFGGVLPISTSVRAFKTLESLHGREAVLAAWMKYCKEMRREKATFASAQNFQKTFGLWSELTKDARTYVDPQKEW